MPKPKPKMPVRKTAGYKKTSRETAASRILRTAEEFATTPRTITDVQSGKVYRVVPDVDAQQLLDDARTVYASEML